MTTIIAGRFEQQSHAQDAVNVLLRSGFSAEEISSFYVNPPGQHDKYPVGGDRDKSPGTEDSSQGTAAGMSTGGLVGAAAGVAAVPLMGPAGPVTGALVGAHIGSLVGTLSKMDEAEETPPIRKSGMFVAVSAREADGEQNAVNSLRAAGALDIERAEGNIVNGDWEDFDPLSAPSFVEIRSEKWA
jgi:hypothetical protein